MAGFFKKYINSMGGKKISIFWSFDDSDNSRFLIFVVKLIVVELHYKLNFSDRGRRILSKKFVMSVSKQN